MSETIRSSSSAVKSPSDLPPERDRKGLRPVSPPFFNMPLYRFNYLIAFFGLAFIAFYAWRVLQWKAEVGGWWNFALGKRPPGADALNPDPTGPANAKMYRAGAGGSSREQGKRATVEDRIAELAAALGMPSSELAAAIADAVREHVPPASLSSVAAHEPSGTAVQYLVDPSRAADRDSGGFEAVASAVQAVVGLEEPPSEIYAE